MIFKENGHYIIDVDRTPNIIKVTLRGFWSERKKEDFESFKRDVLDAINKFFQNEEYVIISDVSAFLTPPMSVSENLIDLQKRLAQSTNLIGVMQIVPENIIAKMSVDRMARKSKIPRESFRDYRDAYNRAVELLEHP